MERKSKTNHLGEKGNIKTFVLDTNVLIHDPESIFAFEDNYVVIPIVVIEELDGLKKGMNAVGVSARKALKIIDSLKDIIVPGVAFGKGKIIGFSKSAHVGAKLDNGGRVIILPSPCPQQ